jgi:hypothetical protein
MYMHVHANASLLQDGRTPLNVAEKWGRGKMEEMEKLLRQHGST